MIKCFSLVTLIKSAKLFCLMALQFMVIDGFSQVVGTGIIPKPLSEVRGKGAFVISAHSKIFITDKQKVIYAFLNKYLKESAGFSILQGNKIEANGINFLIDTTLKIKPEGYILTVSTKRIDVKASDQQGLFYGLQSLIQLIKKDGKLLTVPAYQIKDEPRFAYRGMHLDVARNMFSVTTIKKWLDVLAFYKINTFHWHLTDDQGWRIEIKKYPKLQTQSAYRKETLIGHKRKSPHLFDGKPYGGYYTQEEIKDVVKYAAERQITTIPEIEMPGHAKAVLAAYPNLGCTGGPYETATFWGVFEDVFCAGNEDTFSFLQDVMDEVIPLFPSKFIHIGGDECPKTRWHNCTKCQKRIAQEGLKDEHELQSYFISRIEKYLNAKGKKIIGWDEILEGGLAPDATVMSWRGLEGGIAAAKLKHNVIMTPEKFVYLDYYQSLNKSEPIAAGGYLPLRKIYEYEPMPAELDTTEQGYIKGVQANVWTEYMPDVKKAEYMIFPRVVALAEIGWSAKAYKNYPDFLARLNRNLPFLKDVNYSTSFFEITGKPGSSGFILETDMPAAETRYTLNGNEPTKSSKLYSGPIQVKQSATVKARLFKGINAVGKVYEQKLIKSKVYNKTISLKNSGSGNYNIDKQVLVNGILGAELYNNGEWLGLSGNDFEAVVDLGSETMISQISLNVLNYQWQKMHPPKEIMIEISADNINFKEVAKQTKFPLEGINKVLHQINPVSGRYIRIKAANIGIIPNGFYGAGTKAWLMVDEIIVN